jgi:hypothetical protein
MFKMAAVLTSPPRCAEATRSTSKAAAREKTEASFSLSTELQSDGRTNLEDFVSILHRRT